ncbi:hypothetical protein [Mycolicibacterium porcinum]|uniref:Helix-turn-helix domain containing protein n=1 Tax=Mycolicibacterium porcinum TaxID=39693 RepID=A0ABV3VI37_9MYCO
MNMCAKCGGPDRVGLRRGLCANCYASARRRIGFTSTYVDAEPVREHVQALIDAGLSRRRICHLAGISRRSFHSLLNGVAAENLGPARTVAGHNADRLLAVPLPGPSVHRITDPGQLVPADGTVRRLRSLVAIGYRQADLCRRIGVSKDNGGRVFRGEHPTVRARFACRVDDLFQELQLTPGPHNASRDRAARLGWLPPLAWDEDTIDNPYAAPDLGRDERVRLPEKYVELRELGYSDALIVARLDVTARALERALERDSIPIRIELRRLAREQRREAEAA